MSTATAAESRKGESLKLQIRRLIRADRHRVFDAWTRPEMIRQWFAPGAMEVASITADAHAGGAYYIEMQGTCDEIGTAVRHSAARGRYLEVVPGERLRFTWVGDWDPTQETQVLVEFRDVEGGTELTLTQERFQTAESQGKHELGWSSSLTKLAALLESA